MYAFWSGQQALWRCCRGLDNSPLVIVKLNLCMRFGRVNSIVAYLLALPPSLSSVHDVFHVSMLRKYTPDLTHVGIGASLLLIQMGPLRRDQCV